MHAAFNFDFTTFDSGLAEAFNIFPWNPAWILKKILLREKIFNSAGIWPTTVLSNHDLPRAASRYSRGETDSQARLAMALLLTLRGTPFMYYGEEIGMRDIHLRRREILDPPGKKYWPIYKGRDACRAPMQWDAGPYAGFSSLRPWLPMHPDYPRRNVAAQKAAPDSLFNFTKKLLSLRKGCPALMHGDFVPLEAGPGILAYLRTTPEQTVLVALNFKGRPANFSAPQGNWLDLLYEPPDPTKTAAQLAPYEVRLLVSVK